MRRCTIRLTPTLCLMCPSGVHAPQVKAGRSFGRGIRRIPEDAVLTATMLFHALHGLVHDSATGKRAARERPNRQRLILRGKEFFRRAVEA